MSSNLRWESGYLCIVKTTEKHSNTIKTLKIMATIWNIDPTHSEVQFKVKHLVISTVTGAFKKFSGSIEADGENFDGAKAQFSLDVDSIDTNQADRDGHLKSDDFFAAAQHPTITFKNGVLKKKSAESYSLTGDLTVRDVTKSVVLDVEFGGIMKDPWGNIKAGFELNGKINRKDFGLSWSALTEAGGMVVGDDVKLHLNVEVAKS
jgi:polyisoprenoid-binding protein YceI